MTEAQARENSQKKIKEIQALAAKLHVVIHASQKVDSRSGMIDCIVVYTDQEDYKIDPPAKPVVRGPSEENKNVENTPAQ